MLRRIVSRPDFMKIPELPLPVHVRSAGEFVLPEGVATPYLERKGFVQLFWFISGNAEVVLGKKRYTAYAANVLWKKAHEGHSVRSLSGKTHFRWFTFDGKMADKFMGAYSYPRKLEGVAQCPEHLFNIIEEGLRVMTPESQRHLISVAAEIIGLAGSGSVEKGKASRIIKRFIEMARDNLGDSDININSIARSLDIHRSTLSRYFREKLKVPPGEYLLRMRIQYAIELLRDTDLPISEVARSCGIPDKSYFCRAIVRAVGISPRQVRKSADFGYWQ